MKLAQGTAHNFLKCFIQWLHFVVGTGDRKVFLNQRNDVQVSEISFIQPHRYRKGATFCALFNEIFVGTGVHLQ